MAVRKRYWEWEPVFRLDPKKTALLVIDMQNGFVEPGALLEVPMAREQVPTIAKLIKFCRQRHIPIIYTAVVLSHDFHYPVYVKLNRQMGMNIDPPVQHFAEGKHETQIIPELEPQPGDKIIKKCGYDSFIGTDLDSYLRTRGITDLVITGTVVNWCVDSTVRAAFHRGYNVMVVADAVSGFDHAGLTGEQWRQAELDMFAAAFGRVATAEEVMAELSQGDE